MTNKQYEEMMENLKLVRSVLKDEVSKDRATGEKLADIENFIKQNLDQTKLK
ncbi:MAG: hypothetical protein WA945_10280 [Arcobacteraceae bacterium]